MSSRVGSSRLQVEVDGRKVTVFRSTSAVRKRKQSPYYGVESFIVRKAPFNPTQPHRRGLIGYRFFIYPARARSRQRAKELGYYLLGRVYGAYGQHRNLNVKNVE